MLARENTAKNNHYYKGNPLLMTCEIKGRPLEVTASHTYLGISINNKLGWADHISNTVSMENKVLGLLLQSLYNCSPFVKEIAYMTLVRPKLEYCQSICDLYKQEYQTLFSNLYTYKHVIHDEIFAHCNR